jgi:hypothetical protein
MTNIRTPPRPITSRLTLLVVAGACAVALVGCEGGKAADKVGSPLMPARWDLTTPEKAVDSYLDWTTLAYRMANSDIASKAVDPYELVRVDSYIALNRQQENKGMDRKLTAFRIRGRSQDGTHTLVATAETWDYRYFSLADQTFVSPQYTTSYETTYTVGQFPGSGWLVMDVEAKALDAVR